MGAAHVDAHRVRGHGLQQLQAHASGTRHPPAEARDRDGHRGLFELLTRGTQPLVPVHKDAPLAEFKKIAAGFPVFRLASNKTA